MEKSNLKAMSCTESTNIDISKIAELVLERDNIAICGHTSPDGDCIGSTLAMKCILDTLGKTSWPLVSDEDFDPVEFEFLPCSDLLEFAGDFKGTPDLFICVDVPNSKRLGKFGADVMNRSIETLTIDHHESDKNESEFRYIDPDSASCTLIVWKLARALLEICSDEVFNDQRMRDIAACCYTGLLTDTGRFMFQNTNEECFLSACEMLGTHINTSLISTRLFQEKSLASIKLNAIASERIRVIEDGKVVISWLSKSDIESVGGSNKDTEDCINVIRSLEGTQIACLLKERNETVRGSLRSKGDINVATIASEFGGGGHAGAAGFTLECPLDEAIEIVERRLSEIDFSL